MYLKAACTEVSVPRQRGGPRLERCPSTIQQRQGAGTRGNPSSPTSCPAGGFEASSRPREPNSLEELLQVHRHLFQASAQPGANMVYRTRLFAQPEDSCWDARCFCCCCFCWDADLCRKCLIPLKVAGRRTSVKDSHPCLVLTSHCLWRQSGSSSQLFTH
ncbi:unnamed protein product [Pleuronectes platessa]|uniref:Uncharacterized protein n=1 Tax=Pleuronectes platessa TaxID=8262 RepID=A0A9N7TN85_PLEPL|nr:unnamed protein product [Pleuronectes platessa]